MNYMKYTEKSNEDNVLISKRFMWLLFAVVASLLAFEYIYGTEWRGRVVFWLSFPITAISTYVSCVYWNYDEIISFFVSMLYTFLPWKYFENRSVEHNHQYFVIPLIFVIAMEIAMGKSEDWKVKHHIFLGAILLGTGLVWTDLAHASCAVLFISILYGACKKGRKYFLKTLMFCMILPVSVFLKILREGGIKFSLSEISDESLKLFDFFVPVPNNRFGILSSVSNKALTGGIGVSPAFSMGVLISIGFLILIIWAVTKKCDERMHYICVMNILVLVISHRYCANVFGGWLYPYFKNYKVFYLFIVLFACIALGNILDKLAKRIKNDYVLFIIVLFLTVFNLFSVSSKDWHFFDTDKEVTNRYGGSFVVSIEGFDI